MPTTYGDDLLKVIRGREAFVMKYPRPISELLQQEYELKDKRDHLLDQLTDTENALDRVRGKIAKLFREAEEGDCETKNT